MFSKTPVKNKPLDRDRHYANTIDGAYWRDSDGLLLADFSKYAKDIGVIRTKKLKTDRQRAKARSIK